VSVFDGSPIRELLRKRRKNATFSREDLSTIEAMENLREWLIDRRLNMTDTKSGDTLLKKIDYVRSLTCDKRCPCMCHDTNGSIHDHDGAACYGKLQWPATWQGSLSYWTVN
jgi:hypothetical protein